MLEDNEEIIKNLEKIINDDLNFFSLNAINAFKLKLINENKSKINTNLFIQHLKELFEFTISLEVDSAIYQKRQEFIKKYDKESKSLEKDLILVDENIKTLKDIQLSRISIIKNYYKYLLNAGFIKNKSFNKKYDGTLGKIFSTMMKLCAISTSKAIIIDGDKFLQYRDMFVHSKETALYSHFSKLIKVEFQNIGLNGSVHFFENVHNKGIQNKWSNPDILLSTTVKCRDQKETLYYSYEIKKMVSHGSYCTT